MGAVKRLESVDEALWEDDSCSAFCHKGLRSLLRYVVTDEVPAGDVFLAEIDEAVGRNNRGKAVIGMMIDTMTMLKQEARVQGRAEGRAEGREEGIERYGLLVNALLDTGRADDIRKAGTDPAFRDSLFAEFGIA